MLAHFLRRQAARYVLQQPKEEQRRLRNRILAFQIGPYGWLANKLCGALFGGNLKMLATIYMTDKWNSHWYAQHYEDLLKGFRQKKINILEIGVGGYDDPMQGGNSLRMWHDYFPNGRIYGVDIFDKTPHNQRRIKTFCGSQTDPDFLDALVREIGTIDIVVDDGSHIGEHILFTFRHLFPHLSDQGFYVVEDTLTSYLEAFGGNVVDRNDLNTAMGYFKSLIDGINWEELGREYTPTYFNLNIKSISFYHNLIIIRKGANNEGRCPPD